ncbi:cell division protein DedD [Tatumella ptyseos]|uniref:cell division protein DedD n=1 Tax=Tatumella ptyseos TaxID=82987 RepID=UPI0026EFC4E6|nr:cell division protein DedD [Tatumella ptyseos]WKX25545.1 cell division protein DedD [Tatumella ptyseos]
MASKFQNRMAGTIILVALGVIILPGLLDGKKKHYHEEFAAIPLVPKPGDQLNDEMVPPVTQPIPSKTIRQQAAQHIPADGSAQEASRGSVTSQPQAGMNSTQLQMQRAQEQLAQREAQRLKDQARQQQEAQRQAQAKQQQLAAQQQQAEAQQRQQTAAQSNASSTPTGQAYVIQLGALRNASRVSEVVEQLRGAGFKAYSIPATPVQGQINRILVGPDTSKSHLQSQVAELKAKTGLFGVVMPYRVH